MVPRGQSKLTLDHTIEFFKMVWYGLVLLRFFRGMVWYGTIGKSGGYVCFIGLGYNHVSSDMPLPHSEQKRRH